MLGSLRRVELDCGRLGRGRFLSRGRRGLGEGCDWRRLALCGGVVGVGAVTSRGNGGGRRAGGSWEVVGLPLKETL